MNDKRNLDIQARKIEIQEVDTNNQLYPLNMRDHKTTDEYLN